MKKTDELPLHFKMQGQSDTADGVYQIPHPTINDYMYLIIFSTGDGWEHLSVSMRKIVSKTRRPFKQVERCPTWPEMCFVKNFFWGPEEAVVQFHPAMADYVNNHEYVLHQWKPTQVALPTPEPILVGLKDETLTHLLEWLEKEQPGCEKEYYLAALYYADYSKVNLRDEKSLEEFKVKTLKYLQSI